MGKVPFGSFDLDLDATSLYYFDYFSNFLLNVNKKFRIASKWLVYYKFRRIRVPTQDSFWGEYQSFVTLVELNLDGKN